MAMPSVVHLVCNKCIIILDHTIVIATLVIVPFILSSLSSCPIGPIWFGAEVRKGYFYSTMKKIIICLSFL